MSAGLYKTSVGVLAGTLLAASVCLGAGEPKLSGSIIGIVSDPAGIPQMGATILLYNKFDRLVERALTTESGSFGFAALTPDTYAIRVTLSSFLPALKRNIVVQPGMQSLLNVSLASVFSSVQFVGVLPGDSPIMSDDWKWALRSAAATRPVLRLLPGLEPIQRPAPLFSDTRGLLRLSAGDDASLAGSQPDLGTAFAVATSFLGKNQLQVSGNFGYSSTSGSRASAFRTTYRRQLPDGATPEIQITMRQYDLPVRDAVGVLGAGEGPTLRTLSATLSDHLQLGDALNFEYGFSLDSVMYLDRLNYFSPWGRLTYDTGNGDVVRFAYASGAPPARLVAADADSGAEFQQDLAGLSVFPRVSLRSGAARVQRNETWELGYSRTFGSRILSAAAYSENVSNAAVMTNGAAGFSPAVDLLPDLASDSWILNAGGYRTVGYMASLTQNLGAHTSVSVAYGNGGALTTGPESDRANSADDLRQTLDLKRRQTVTTRVAGTLPASGTAYAASYQWASTNALNPTHLYLTERLQDGAGLSFRFRQPLPYFGGLPCHLAATAEMRNLLAQGYVPIMAGGRRLYLMHSPRTVRGGLSFTF
jgi:hypothetical protein